MAQLNPFTKKSESRNVVYAIAFNNPFGDKVENTVFSGSGIFKIIFVGGIFAGHGP